MKKIILFLIISAVCLFSFAADVDLTGWQLKQYNSSQTYTFGSVVIPSGGYVIVCRGAKKAAFETYYGITLPSNVVFIDSAYSVPQINGAETYSLYNGSGVQMDTTFIALTAGGSYYRDSTNTNSFTRIVFSTTTVTPGSVSGTVIDKGMGVVVTEVVDAASYLYEYVELYNDTGIASNTSPVIINLQHTPAIVGAGEDVAVSADITDNGTIANDTCFYRVNSGAWSKIVHTGLSGDTYSYSIGSFSASDTVDYYVKAVDDESASSLSDTNNFIVTALSSGDININGWQLNQYNSSQTYTFGDITVPGGGYVIICRGKTKADFETYYGVTLGSNVTFIDSTYNMPNINGGEVYSLYNESATLIDTTFFTYSSGGTYYRDSTNTNTFTRIPFAISTATPGSMGSTLINKGKGLVISEVADASDYFYEYVELYNDTLGVGNTVIASVARSPFLPLADEADTIFAKIISPSGLKSVKLYTSAYDSSDIDTYNMIAYSSDTLFRFILPGRGNDCRFEYYVEAIDSNDVKVTSDAGRFFWGYTSIPRYKENTDEGYARWINYNVRATGIVTVGTGVYNTTQNIINFQKNYILGAVWKNDSILSDGSETVIPGDSVVVEGTIIFSAGQTRIGNPYSKLTKYSSGHAIDTILVTADDLADTTGDAYEGLLVQINALSKKSGTWPTTGGSALIVMNEMAIKGKSKAIDTFLVWIDGDTDVDDNLEPVWPTRIVGILTQYDISAPYWSMYEIYPRAYEDMLSATAIENFYLTAVISGDCVVLNWSVEGFDNIAMFRVERKYENEKVFTIVKNLKKEASGYSDRTADLTKNMEYRVVGITSDGGVIEFSSVEVKRISSIHENKMVISSNVLKGGSWMKIYSAVKNNVDMNLYDANGRKIKKLYSGIINAGVMQLYVDTKDVPNGTYFIRDSKNAFTESVKINIVK